MSDIITQWDGNDGYQYYIWNHQPSTETIENEINEFQNQGYEILTEEQINIDGPINNETIIINQTFEYIKNEINDNNIYVIILTSSTNITLVDNNSNLSNNIPITEINSATENQLGSNFYYIIRKQNQTTNTNTNNIIEFNNCYTCYIKIILKDLVRMCPLILLYFCIIRYK